MSEEEKRKECSPNCPLCNELTPEEEEAARIEEPTLVKISSTAARAVDFENPPWNEFNWETIHRGKGSSVQTTMPRGKAIEFAKYLMEDKSAANSTKPTDSQAALWASKNGMRILEQLGVEQ